AFSAVGAQLEQRLAGEWIGENLLDGTLGNVKPMRQWRGWAAELCHGDRKVKRREGKPLMAIEVDIDKLARGRPQADANVLIGAEGGRQVVGHEEQLWPTIDARFFEAGGDRHDPPAALGIDERLVERSHRTPSPRNNSRCEARSSSRGCA